MGKVRTRFAPSPTGFMHIGNLRTALYAYLYARANDGVFVLRIEDTDQSRYVEGAVDAIYKTLELAHLSHDEGPDVGGEYGPYVQSQRLGLYKEYALQLVEKGGAYFCFCDKSSDESDDNESAFTGYDRRCRNIDPEEAKQRVENGEAYVIRQKMPLTGVTQYADAVFGDVEVSNDQLDDQVLIKRDGMPTYNFANVIDDHLMGITHVIRGTEYIVSTPKYKLLYEAFGWKVPVFVHLPLIMGQNEDGSVSKLSKRHGATGFEQLIQMGYLPQAIINYIALLGWSPKSNEEIFSLSELERLFTLEGIGHSASVFDYKKLDWMNGQYISALPDDVFMEKSIAYAGELDENLRSKWSLIAAILKTRLSRLNETEEKIAFLKQLNDYDSELFINKKNKTDIAKSRKILTEIRGVYEETSEWSSPVLFEIAEKYARENEMKTGTVMWPVRIAVSGLSVTPGGATEIMEILGKEESLKRIDFAIDKVSGA